MTDSVYLSMRMDNKEKLHMVKVKDVASQIRGVTFAKSDVLKHAEKGYVPVLRAGNIEDATASVSWSDIVYIPTEKVRQVQFLRNNDVVIAASSGSLAAIGKCAQFKSNDALCEDVSFGAFLKVLRPNAIDVDPQYFAYYFRTKEYRAIISHLASGANINNLRNQDIDNLEFYLPPLEEQRRIVGILDRADAIRAKRRQLLADYDELPRSLFVEMFGGKTFPNVKSGVLMPDMRNGLSPSKRGAATAKVLTLSAITQGGFNVAAVKEGTFDIEPPQDKRVSSHDFMMCRGNGNKSLVGVGAYSKEDLPELVFPDTIIAGRVNTEKVLLPYLEMAWRSKSVREQIEKSARTTNGTYKVNQQSLSNISIPLPPLPLQREFARRVEAIAAVRAKVERALALDDELFASLQSRAFRGEL